MNYQERQFRKSFDNYNCIKKRPLWKEFPVFKINPSNKIAVISIITFIKRVKGMLES